MKIPRRTFLRTAPAALATASLDPATLLAAPAARTRISDDRFDPWIEVERSALQANLAEVRRIVGGRPILAVVKNNAYGLGLLTAASILEPLAAIAGFAVVKTEAALALREAGISKPVYLMARFPKSAAADLARHKSKALQRFVPTPTGG